MTTILSQLKAGLWKRDVEKKERIRQHFMTFHETFTFVGNCNCRD